MSIWEKGKKKGGGGEESDVYDVCTQILRLILGTMLIPTSKTRRLPHHSSRRGAPRRPRLDIALKVICVTVKVEGKRKDIS